MADRYCDNKEPGPDAHSIPVFSRPFLEYTKSYPSPSQQGASPDISRAGVLFFSPPGVPHYPGYPLGIAAIQIGNNIKGQGGFSAPAEMPGSVLCAAFSDRAITVPVEVLAALGIADPQLTLTPPSGALGQYPVLRALDAPSWAVISGEQRFLVPERPDLFLQ